MANKKAPFSRNLFICLGFICLGLAYLGFICLSFTYLDLMWWREVDLNH